MLRPITTAFQRRPRPTGTELVHRPSPLNMRLWLAVLRGVHSDFSPVPTVWPKTVVLLAQTNAWSVLEQCLCVHEEGNEVEKKQELQFISNGLSRLVASTGLVHRALLNLQHRQLQVGNPAPHAPVV